jgi:hypothetical protein
MRQAEDRVIRNQLGALSVHGLENADGGRGFVQDIKVDSRDAGCDEFANLTGGVGDADFELGGFFFARGGEFF